MEEPKNYAIIEDGIVVNVISILESNAADFPNAILCYGVGIGYSYQNGEFINPNPDLISKGIE